MKDFPRKCGHTRYKPEPDCPHCKRLDMQGAWRRSTTAMKKKLPMMRKKLPERLRRYSIP